jgi:hypothetical protein
VIAPVESALMLPILALKVAVLFPAAITMLVGTAIRADVELNVTVVGMAAGCDTVAVHELIIPDITPLGLQVNEVTSMVAVRGIVTDCAEPL